MRTSIRAAFGLVLCTLLMSGNAVRTLKQAPATIEDALTATADLSVLHEAIKQFPGLEAAIKSPDTAVTVFAPSNEAILATLAALKIGSLDGLLNSSLPVGDILQYHLVGAPVKSTDLTHGAPIFTTLAGTRLIADLEASDAPIIRGRNSAGKVITADVMAGKSVIHIVDAVLLPVNPMPPTYATVAEAATAAKLTSLVAALTKADLVSAVADPALEATILAPTDEAFAAALTALNTTLEDIDVETLKKVLTYHVAPGYGPSPRFVANGEVKTLLADQTLKWVYTSPTSKLPTIVAAGSNATIVTPDVFAGKSVVHVVDTVLVPNLA